MQVLVVGTSLALVGPNVLNSMDGAASPHDISIMVDRVDGPFEAAKVDGGSATGAALQSALPGAHVAWVLQLSARGAVTLDLNTRLMRQQDQLTVSWSHRSLCVVGPDPQVYILDQVLPTDLKPGRYHIVQDASVHGLTVGHQQLPAISIEVLAGTRS